ncbi:hypothetical protein ABIE89_000314 [Bradyrhizobium niftali]
MTKAIISWAKIVFSYSIRGALYSNSTGTRRRLEHALGAAAQLGSPIG